MSLSDDAITALSAVRQVGENLDDDHPMRHVVRNMKRSAETILGDAIRQATDLAYQAAQLVKDYDDSLKQK